MKRLGKSKQYPKIFRACLQWFYARRVGDPRRRRRRQVARAADALLQREEMPTAAEFIARGYELLGRRNPYEILDERMSDYYLTRKYYEGPPTMPEGPEIVLDLFVDCSSRWVAVDPNKPARWPLDGRPTRAKLFYRWDFAEESPRWVFVKSDDLNEWARAADDCDELVIAGARESLDEWIPRIHPATNEFVVPRLPKMDFRRNASPPSGIIPRRDVRFVRCHPHEGRAGWRFDRFV